MESVRFGEEVRRIFAWLHRPPAGRARRTAVVVCPPFGNEYVLAHRALHVLGGLLSAAGFVTIRPDYSGTGDSDGETEDANLEAWREDLELAAAELRDRCSIEDIAWVGMRVGANLAARCAQEERILPAAALVLWDPIEDGEALARSWSDGPADAGFAIGPAMEPGLRSLSRPIWRDSLEIPVLEVGRAEGGLATPARDSFVVTEAPSVWEDDDRRTLVPHRTLQQLVHFLEQSC